jgi:hypothetical protein
MAKSLDNLAADHKASIEAIKKKIGWVWSPVSKTSEDWTQALSKVHQPLPVLKITKVETLRPPVTHRSVPIPAHGPDGMGSPPEVQFGKCERGIVAFMAINPGRSWTKTQVAIGSGYSVKSGGFTNALSKLRTAGILRGSGQELRINTDTASQVLGGIDELKGDVKEQWEKNLGKCERQIWQFLLTNPTAVFTKQELADNTGYSVISGGYTNALSRLNTLKIIKRVEGGIMLNPEILEI